MQRSERSAATRPRNEPGTGYIIDAQHVTKTYTTGSDHITALDDITFQVKRGEMVAVMGPSGCGKTTMINCLSGLDHVDAGTIAIDGTDLSTMSDKARTSYRARNMGFIFQVYNLLPVLTAAENVELPLLVSRVAPSEARRRSLEALDRVGLRDWAGHRPAELSGGQNQRVTVARALVNTPAIVWADEPTGALDSQSAGDILDLLRELNQRDGLSIVLVTHDRGVGNQCHRIVTMQDGRITGETAPERHAGAARPSGEDEVDRFNLSGKHQ